MLLKKLNVECKNRHIGDFSSGKSTFCGEPVYIFKEQKN